MQSIDVKIFSLVEAIAQRNDKNAYRNLFGLLYPKLKAFVSGFLKDTEIAEEIAGDVMITLWRNRAGLTTIENIRVYAYIVAKNLCLDHLRKKKLQLTHLEPEMDFAGDYQTPEQLFVTHELKLQIQEGVNSLPPQCKLVFHLVKEEHLSYKEAAEVLNISVKTVDAHLVTSLKKIASFLKREYNLAR